MPYTVYTTNQPDVEKEVDDNEFVDLQRMGLLVSGKGDLNDKGELKRQVASQAPPEVRAATPTLSASQNPQEG